MFTLNQQKGAVAETLIRGKQAATADTSTWRLVLMNQLIHLLIEQATARQTWPQVYRRALRVLDTVPMGTADYDLAVRRLSNALTYSSREEFGAATFELRMLRGQLKV